jgi:hypothetical protein
VFLSELARGGSGELIDKAIQIQRENIQKKIGKSLDELTGVTHKSGLTTHGDANMLLHHVLKSDSASAAAEPGTSKKR